MADELAAASALSVATIRRAELKESETSLTTANDLAIRRALEAAGVEFINRRERRRPRSAVTKTAPKKELDLGTNSTGENPILSIRGVVPEFMGMKNATRGREAHTRNGCRLTHN
jgi:hypothetical protein